MLSVLKLPGVHDIDHTQRAMQQFLSERAAITNRLGDQNPTVAAAAEEERAKVEHTGRIDVHVRITNARRSDAPSRLISPEAHQALLGAGLRRLRHKPATGYTNIQPPQLLKVWGEVTGGHGMESEKDASVALAVLFKTTTKINDEHEVTGIFLVRREDYQTPWQLVLALQLDCPKDSAPWRLVRYPLRMEELGNVDPASPPPQAQALLDLQHKMARHAVKPDFQTGTCTWTTEQLLQFIEQVTSSPSHVAQALINYTTGLDVRVTF